MLPDNAEFFQTYALSKLSRVEQLLGRESHWCKGALRNGERYCILGALDAAGGRYLLEGVVLRAARELSGRRYWRIESFNDDRRTTHADVLRVLHRAQLQVASGEVSVAAAEPWSRRCGRNLRDLCRRSAATLKPQLARLTRGIAGMGMLPAAAAE